jgi:fumarate hydratase subunit alpha
MSFSVIRFACPGAVVAMSPPVFDALADRLSERGGLTSAFSRDAFRSAACFFHREAMVKPPAFGFAIIVQRSPLSGDSGVREQILAIAPAKVSRLLVTFIYDMIRYNMRIVKALDITTAVKRLFREANHRLPPDVQRRIRECRQAEPFAPARDALDQIIANFEIAEEQRMPICQDTGMACVFVEIGNEAHIEGDLAAAVDEGVRQACKEGFLRASVVSDPLERTNSGDNTPALLYLDLVPGDAVSITVAPKGFGSENMSRIAMLKPSDGEEGLIRFVLESVERAGPNPCPPIVVGIGIGGSFDKAALLAKKALLRPLGCCHPKRFYAGLERRLLERINALGIGPAGFGGKTTALFAAIEAMPTHIAGLPVALNINCHVSRHAQERL